MCGGWKFSNIGYEDIGWMSGRKGAETDREGRLVGGQDSVDGGQKGFWKDDYQFKKSDDVLFCPATKVM